MFRKAKRPAWPAALGGLVLIAAGGCGLLVDFFDPDLAGRLGLDPATIKPQQGTVIVAFANSTRYPAAFNAYWSRDANNLAGYSRNFSVDVPSGNVRNEVLECPVGVISPGSLDSTFTPSGLAVVVQAAGEAAQVEYAGPPLISGDGFFCGDVIEIRVSAIGTGDTATYAVSVRVIRGR